MDAFWSVVLVGTLATAVVAGVLWLMTKVGEEREREGRELLGNEVSWWAGRRHWAVIGEPDSELQGSFPRRTGHEVLTAAEGELAGRRAALMMCTDEYEDGVSLWAVVVLRLPVHFPRLEVQHRYIVAKLWKAQNPASPDPSAGDENFHRRLKIGRATSAAGAALLTEPVRAALLRLSAMGDHKYDFVDLREDTLSVAIAGWPPGLDLELLVGTVAELAQALLHESGG